MVAQVKPDNYGNGRIDVSIQQSNEQSLELHNGWSVKRIYAGWDWNRYRTYIDLIDSFDHFDYYHYTNAYCSNGYQFLFDY